VIESAVAIASGTIPPILSTQELVDCLPSIDSCGGTGGCQGGSQQFAMSYAMLRGLTYNGTYPYKAVDDKCKMVKPMSRGGNEIENITLSLIVIFSVYISFLTIIIIL